MMIPWIQIYSNLLTHPKTSKLADILNLSSKDASANVIAAGLLVSLWTWAIQNAYNGDLSGCSPRAIAEAARYKKKPELFVQALQETGWLDPDGKLHDWDEYASRLIDMQENQREKTKERVKRYRDKQKAIEKQECNASVTVTCNACNADTLHKPLPIHNNPHNNSAPNTVDGIPEPPDAPAPISGKAFTSFWDAYPKKIDREGAWEAWKTLNPSADVAEQIMSALAVYKTDSQWIDDGDRYIPKAAKFLREEYWKSPPRQPCGYKGVPKGASGQLGGAELEAIQRVLKEGAT